MPKAKPQLPGNVHVAPTADELYDDLAMTLLGAATRAVDERGIFHLALSGGSTPEPFYLRLNIDNRFHTIPWKQTHIWLVDERCVPPDDPRNNGKMIRETLTDHVPMRRRQIHLMPVEGNDPAGVYEAELREVIGNGSQHLDFVLLGLGADGHTASLFPHSPALRERERLVVVNDGPTVTPPPRLTMTYPLLNAARQLAVLVTGERKAVTIQQVAQQMCDAGPDAQHWPITGIQPEGGQLDWYLDQPAAGLMSH